MTYDILTSKSPRNLLAIHGRPTTMPAYHYHNDIEINYVERGSITYLFSRGKRTIAKGAFSVFWAMLPHRVIALEDDPTFYCIHIPLSWFLQWRPPSEIVSQLLHGNVVVDGSPHLSRVDKGHFPIWYDDIMEGAPHGLQTVLLELQARLRRASISLDVESAHVTVPGNAAAIDKLGTMTAYIAENYTRNLTPADVASRVELHPKYAMTIFRRAFGVTMVEYITQLLISHAQRLLATTDLNIAELALEAGFGSVSQFYDAFTRACRTTPRAFRRETCR